ncbi:MAG: phosphoglycerate kinase [Acidobacteria bacterium]|nr:MAG: phosphoglycerate kinase [Acidobacteriota bacterium]
MNKLTIRDAEPAGRRLFLRVDFNVPLDSKGAISDDTRIQASLPTIRYGIEHGAKLILASHLGRPKGQPVGSMTLRPAAERLAELVRSPVAFANDCVGPEVEAQARGLAAGGVLLLENLRFHPEEEKNEEGFSRRLAALADLYVNDAFGSAHRAHASTVGITKYLAPALAGFLMEREINYLSKAVENPARPYTAIVGGAKVSDKMELLQNLMKFADNVLIGGAMAYTFLKARGVEVGKSRVEDDKLELARNILSFGERRSIRIRLPEDHVVTEKLEASAHGEISAGGIPAGRLGADIGPATRAQYAAVIADSKTIVWNGPLGVFEIPQFAEGTLAVARAVAASSAVSIVGGGDSAAAVHLAGVGEKITHVSTGGGATLEFLSGRKLPGVEALTDRE